MYFYDLEVNTQKSLKTFSTVSDQNQQECSLKKYGKGNGLNTLYLVYDVILHLFGAQW